MARSLLGTLAANVTTQSPTVAFTLDITLADGVTVKRLTTFPVEQTVSGNVYTPSGLTLARLRFGFNQDRASSEANISMVPGSPIQLSDIDAGIYRSAKFEIGMFDWSVAAPTKTVLLAGLLGQPQWDDSELNIIIELKGLLRSGQKIVVWKNTPNCKATLGDSDCRLPLIEDPSVTHITARADSTAYTIPHHIRVLQASSYNDRIFELKTAGTSAGTPPTFDLTIGNDTTDGSAVWTARDSWIREATVATIIDQHKFTVTVSEARAVDGWFGGFGEGQGLAIFRDVLNVNRQMEIIKWTNSTAEVQLAAPMPFPIAVSDKLDMVPSDSKRFETCWDKFSHGLDFVGEPYTGPAEVVDIAS